MKRVLIPVLVCVCSTATFSQVDDRSISPAAVEQACRQLARSGVGQSKLNLMVQAAARAIQVRISSEDGNEFSLYEDVRRDRLTVRVERQTVVAAECR